MWGVYTFRPEPHGDQQCQDLALLCCLELQCGGPRRRLARATAEFGAMLYPMSVNEIILPPSRISFRYPSGSVANCAEET
jgi:hypothetical protein